LKTAIYIRVSTEEQAKEGYSISAQMQKLKAFCVSQGWEVEGIYADEGVSAKDMNRPKLKAMIEDIKNNKIECVLVYRLDRLTRSVLDLYKMLEIFEKYDCKFKSATEVYDTTTAMGRMFITIVAALAQWERENMGERISFGYAEKVRQGKYAHNVSPFGFTLDKKTSKLVIEPGEAQIVKEIFRLYKSGLGFNRVSKSLNDRKMYSKAGNEWNDNTIMKIIRNPIYYGATKWRDDIVENTHEGVISKDDYVIAQKLKEERKMAPPRSVSSRYIFSGKLKCAECGRTLTGSYSTSKTKAGLKIYPQYRCRHRRVGRCNGIKNVSQRKLEEAFVRYLDEINYEEVIESSSKIGVERLNKKEKNTIDVSSLELQLKRIEQRKKKWQYAWTEDIISHIDFKKRMEEAKQEESSIRDQLKSAEVEPDEKIIDKSEIVKSLKNIKRNWNVLDDMDKKNLVNLTVQKINYKHTGNDIEIEDIDYKIT
jgi:site-specific DNA recombinase